MTDLPPPPDAPPPPPPPASQGESLPPPPDAPPPPAGDGGGRWAALRDRAADARRERAARPDWAKARIAEGGIRVANGQIRHRRDVWPLAGAEATVETAGEMRTRLSATRIALIGIFALGARKKVDKRELYITVEGPDFAFVESVNPKRGKKAREFAAQLTTLGRQAAADLEQDGDQG